MMKFGNKMLKPEWNWLHLHCDQQSHIVMWRRTIRLVPLGQDVMQTRMNENHSGKCSYMIYDIYQ